MGSRETEKYFHHAMQVSVMEGNKGKHKENCLCFNGCLNFIGCPIREELYAFSVKYNTVNPVWECPEYQAEKEQKC